VFLSCSCSMSLTPNLTLRGEATTPSRGGLERGVSPWVGNKVRRLESRRGRVLSVSLCLSLSRLGFKPRGFSQGLEGGV
jgi:hypothetical protein